jgi:uncharacterized protein
MEIIGYTAAIFIGISLGLIGSGGSILTVPVMVYLFAIEPSLATSYSLFVVGSASAVGAYYYYKKGLINIRAGLLFGSFSIIAVTLTRNFLIPLIPETVVKIGSYTITGSFFAMVPFAILMLFASASMIAGKSKTSEPEEAGTKNLYKLPLYGLIIGFITGSSGIGGGFIIVPALVLLAGMPMSQAVGTSLFIITLNSFTGFLGDAGHFEIDWFFLFKITAIAVAGIFAGSFLGRTIQVRKLKMIYGWFIITIAVCILVKETLYASHSLTNNIQSFKISFYEKK